MHILNIYVAPVNKYNVVCQLYLNLKTHDFLSKKLVKQSISTYDSAYIKLKNSRMKAAMNKISIGFLTW